MADSTTVSFDERYQRFIGEQVDSGRFDSAGAVVEEGLRLLEERESRLEALRAALIEGEMSGPAQPIDIDAFLAAKRAEWQE